jgi:hypothetical protein
MICFKNSSGRSREFVVPPSQFDMELAIGLPVDR